MAEVLMQHVNPHGNVQAVVEADGRVCFFYLFGSPESELGMKSVWLCNLQPAPAELDVNGMNSGVAPMNPAAHGCEEWKNPQFKAAVLVRDHPSAPPLTLPLLYGDPVNVLWLLPLSEMERKLAMKNGSEAMLGKLEAYRWKLS